MAEQKDVVVAVEGAAKEAGKVLIQELLKDGGALDLEAQIILDKVPAGAVHDIAVSAVAMAKSLLKSAAEKI